MAQGIRLVKLVSGEVVLGKYDEKTGALIDVASLQVNIKPQGMQVMMLPYGYPFQHAFTARIDEKFIMFTFETLPDNLEAKYNDACLRKVPILTADVSNIHAE